jgi:dienelactone hydrolase
MKKWLAFLSLLFLAGSPAWAELKTQKVEYKDGDTVLEGYLAYDDSFTGKRPGILVVHEWTGLGHYVESRCDQLAKLGYVAFAADIYGKAEQPTDMKACMAQATKYKTNRPLMRERVNAGLVQLQKNEMVDPAKIAAIGYCFGGTTVLELGRSGAPIAGIVSFHGGLDNPTPADDKNIKAKVLICQGGEDKFTLGDLPALKKSLSDAKVDYKVVVYPGAVHGFTNPDNTGKTAGVKYDVNADKNSWAAMMDFFKKIFKS